MVAHWTGYDYGVIWLIVFGIVFLAICIGFAIYERKVD